jgi:hypothetical protein
MYFLLAKFKIKPKFGLPTKSLGILSAVNFFRIGFQLVAIAWLAIRFTGQAASVGQVLLISSIASIGFSPILGGIVDSIRNKKTLVALGHSCIAFAACVPFVADILPLSEFSWLLMIAVLSTGGSVLFGGGMDYFLKIHIRAEERMQKLALLNSVNQIALIIGTLAAGLCLSAAPYQVAFFVLICCAILMIALTYFLLPTLIIGPCLERCSQYSPIYNFSLYAKYPAVFFVATSSALVFSLGQITNTLVPALVQLKLKLPSFNYSAIEAAWALGALGTSAYLTRKKSSSSCKSSLEWFFLMGMAITLVFVPFLEAFIFLLAAHVILGIGFAMVRVKTETQFLATCPTHLLGRFRANSLCITSMLGIFVYIVPSLKYELSVTYLYCLMGGGVFTLVIFFYLLEKLYMSRLR